MTYIESISRFMELGGQEVPDTPGWPLPEESELRVALVREEFNELLEAEKESDIAGVVDAYADIAVVALGGLITYAGEEGATQVMEEVLRANQSKVSEGAIRDENGKIQKPEGFQPPDIEGILDRLMDPYQIVFGTVDEDNRKGLEIWVSRDGWYGYFFYPSGKCTEIFTETRTEMITLLGQAYIIALLQGTSDIKAMDQLISAMYHLDSLA